jgi:hypothetical protein
MHPIKDIKNVTAMQQTKVRRQQSALHEICGKNDGFWAKNE